MNSGDTRTAYLLLNRPLVEGLFFSLYYRRRYGLTLHFLSVFRHSTF